MRAIIDADSLIYSSCCKLTTENPFDETQKTIDINMLKYAFDQKIKFLTEKIRCKTYSLYISGKDNFRYKIYKEYKAHRKESERPLGLEELRQHAIDKHHAIESHKAEADDYVVADKLRNPEDLLVAIDKDVLNFIEGRHYNYWKEDFIETSKIRAIQWPYIQTLTGDGADNIIGLYRIGIKTAEKLLGDETDEKVLWQIVTDTYLSKNRPIKDAILNMRLVRMDQFKENKLKLWKPSHI